MKGWRPAALATLLLGVVGVGGDPPEITDIQVVPSRVVVGADPSRETTFEIEARPWAGDADDPVSITERDGYSLVWTVNEPWLTRVAQQGFRARFRIAPGATATGPATIDVEAGGKTSSAGAKIEIVPNAGAATGAEAVLAAYAPDLPPDVVLVRGARASAADDCVSVAAFVERTMVGPLVGPCSGDDASWGAAVLSPDHAMVVRPPVAWTPGPDPLVDVTSEQTPPLALPLALRIMVAPHELDTTPPDKLRDSALAVAKDDIAAANVILRQSRAGVAFDPVFDQVIPVPLPVQIASCTDGNAVTGSHDQDGVLNVYYVNGLSNNRGLTCDGHDGRDQTTIYVDWDAHGATTLVHELGHALGLMLPGFGHTDHVGGLDRTNIMTSGDNDTDRGGRQRFTVGQAFRMSVEPGSWLNAASWPARDPNHKVRASSGPRVRCQCGAHHPHGRCPDLGDDFAPRSARTDGVLEWDCWDHLHLDVSDEGEDPVAVIAGRRWGDALGACSDDVQGVSDPKDGFAFLRFENLVEAGKCPAWAAVFFRKHGVLFVPLTDPNNAFTSSGEKRESNVEVPEPIKLPVQLYYPGSDQSAVRNGKARAETVFGSANRTGIQLDFDEHRNKPCPAITVSKDIVICWLAGGSGEGHVAGRHIEVHGGGATISTMSWFVGQALRLPIVTGQSATEVNNVMQSDPATRGTTLTLNQVLRMNSVLQPGLCGAGPCPILGGGKGP